MELTRVIITTIFTASSILLYFIRRVHAVPPEACFQDFKFQDCGKPAVPVMYYYKPGSRCEIGQWRGCLPNLNMFKDEYECITTCIFSSRALPEDYHSFNEIPYDDIDYDMPEDTTISGNITDGNVTVATNETTAANDNGTAVTQASANGTGNPNAPGGGGEAGGNSTAAGAGAGAGTGDAGAGPTTAAAAAADAAATEKPAE